MHCQNLNNSEIKSVFIIKFFNSYRVCKMARNGPGKGQRSLLGGKRRPHGKSILLLPTKILLFNSISVRFCRSVIKLAFIYFLIYLDERLTARFPVTHNALPFFRRHYRKIGSLAKQRILKIYITLIFHRGQAPGTILAMGTINHCMRKRKRKRKFP